MYRKNGIKHSQTCAQMLGTEDDQCQHNEKEGDEALTENFAVGVPIQLRFLAQHTAERQCAFADNLVDTVQKTPKNEFIPCTMPNAADSKGDEQIQIFAQATPAASAQGDINVVAQPSAEGNVPSPPEILDGGRKIRMEKVVGDLDAEQTGNTLCKACTG